MTKENTYTVWHQKRGQFIVAQSFKRLNQFSRYMLTKNL